MTLKEENLNEIGELLNLLEEESQKLDLTKSKASSFIIKFVKIAPSIIKALVREVREGREAKKEKEEELSAIKIELGTINARLAALESRALEPQISLAPEAYKPSTTTTPKVRSMR